MYGAVRDDLRARPAGLARRCRRARGPPQPLRQQLPRSRKPPRDGRGRTRGARPVGLRHGVRPLHLRHPGAAPRARGAPVGVPRHRGHDPLRLLLRRERRRLRYANGDMDELEARLVEASDARFRLIATDGVFSMDGYAAKLDEICDVAERHDALVLVDDSHAVGFVGPQGRGTHAQFDVVERVDVLTGTLGKAVGGASGGYVSGRQEVVDILRQRARPYLFSNSVAPVVVGASLRALGLIERSDDLRDRLWTNTRSFRTQMTELRFDVLPGDHPIVPVMVGDASEAARFSRALVAHGVFAVAFSYPVVPLGTARIRTQMSAAHTDADLEAAVQAFVAARAETSA